MRSHRILKVVAFITCALVVLALASWLVMALWNALIPALFAGPVVSFWQAAGLLILSRVLVGGLRGRGGYGWRHRAWRERWERMSPEERERVREGFVRWRDMSPEQRAELRKQFRGCSYVARGGASQAGGT